MLKKILLVVAALGLILAVVVALQPAAFSISRSATISAPDSVVFAQLNDFHNWEAWSPWSKLDPAMKATYAGPAAGAGAEYSWAGNKDVGEGRMTILESTPSSAVRIKLEFLAPFAATNTAVFTLTPTTNGTIVVWTMTGRNNFMAKGANLVMNMDKMVGGDFEKGLAQLKTISEAAVPAPLAAPAP
ncbi:MAG: SRPBCC family protein [Gemmatimonadales bacterium]